MSIEDSVSSLTQATTDLLTAVNVQKSTLDTAVSSATSVVSNAISTQVPAAIAAQATTLQSYTNQTAAAAAIQSILATPPAALPYEVTAISGGVGTGTGGTPGEYAMGVTGGPAGHKAFVTIDSTGKVLSYRLANPGISVASTVPTYSFTSVTGLTGATVPTATVGVIPVGRLFFAPSADFTQLLAWGNNAGALATSPFGGTQVKITLATNVVGGVIADSTSYVQSGYRYTVTGSDGNLLFGVDDATYPTFVVGGIKELTPALYPKTQMNLGGTTVSYSGGNGYTQSGKAAVWSDQSGNELFGVSDDAFPAPLGAMSPFKNARPEYHSSVTAGYELFTQRDTNNLMQVYSRSLSTFAVTQLSSNGVDNINPRFDSTNTKAVWATSSKDRWFSKQLRTRKLNGSSIISNAYPARYLTVIGDSIAAGTGASVSGNAFATKTGTSLNLTLNSRAIGGQQVWQQAMQMGAIPTILTVASTTLTTSGISVSAIATVHPTTGVTYSCTVVGQSGVSLYPNTMLLSTAAEANAHSLSGWIVDSSGIQRYVTLTRTATGTPSTSEVYTLASSTGISITLASTTVSFIVDTGDQHNYVMIYEGGINDISQGINATNRTAPSAATVISDIIAVQDATIAKNASAIQAYAVVGIYNPAASWAVTGSAPDLAIIAYNNDRRTKYGARFVDAFAILAAGNNGSTQDLSDVTNHYLPTSEQYDQTHPNDTGHAAIANGNSAGKGTIAVLTAQIAALPTN